MNEKNKIRCPNCGETELIIEHSRTPTFDETVIEYKCLKCNKIFND